MVTTIQRPKISPPANPYQRVKSTLDFFAALFLIIVLAPLLLCIGIVIRLDSRGSVIYRQRRVGMRGAEFTIFKFRSMRVDAPCLSTEELQRLALNPVTRVGALLRKTSLDELPQLFNILKGEMSFIGPRPALPTQVDVNEMRHTLAADVVRPGITGLAQVMGRDDLDTTTKVHYDAEYCRRMNFIFDAKIVGMTGWAILSSRGNK